MRRQFLTLSVDLELLLLDEDGWNGGGASTSLGTLPHTPEIIIIINEMNEFCFLLLQHCAALEKEVVFV